VLRADYTCLADEQEDVGEEHDPQLESADDTVVDGLSGVWRRFIDKPDDETDSDRQTTVENHAHVRDDVRPVDLFHFTNHTQAHDIKLRATKIRVQCIFHGKFRQSSAVPTVGGSSFSVNILLHIVGTVMGSGAEASGVLGTLVRYVTIYLRALKS